MAIATPVSAAETYTVKYINSGFVPNELTISLEDTLRFTNNSTSELKLVADPRSTHPQKNLASFGLIEPIEGLGVVQFTETGTHIFMNASNPEHTGTVTVVAQAPTPTPTPDPDAPVPTPTDIPYKAEVMEIMGNVQDKVLAAKDEADRDQTIALVTVFGGIVFLSLNLGFAGYMLYVRGRDIGGKPKRDAPTDWERTLKIRDVQAKLPGDEPLKQPTPPAKLDGLDRWMRRN